MPELRRIDLSEARRLCPDNFSKGSAYFRDGALTALWRTSSALHASVAGSASQPYEASIGPRDDGSYWGRCNCPAARRQGICKHAAAVLVAWAEKPDLFDLRPEPETRPDGAPRLESEAKRARAPRVDRQALLSEGMEKAEALLVDLASQGLLSVTGEQVEAIESLAGALEAHKLRRLARQISEVHRAATRALKDGDGFDEMGWARLLSDSWFVLTATRKAMEKGDPSQKAELEELVGRTWLEKELQPAADLRLVELAYQTDVLSSGFRVETSFLLDLAEGTLYTEKQITPLRLKDVPAKRSYRHPIRAARAGIYPGFPPPRIKLIEAEEVPEDGDVWERAVALAESSAAGLRQRLTQSTASPVAPQESYALFRPAATLVRDGAIYLVDQEGKAIPVGGGRWAGLFGLRGALARGRAEALFCRVYFGGGAMEAEPLSAILGSETACERLVRLTG